MKITQQFLDELEQKIANLKRALRRKEKLDKLGDKITIDVPFFNKQIGYTIILEDKQKIEQEVTNKEQELKDKIKEIIEKP